MSRQRLPQITDADTAEAAPDSPSLATGSPESKARLLPASPGAVTAKGAVGETQLSEIVETIVAELHPHRRPKKDVQETVWKLIELLPTEVAELQGRLGVYRRPKKDIQRINAEIDCAISTRARSNKGDAGCRSIAAE